MSGDGADKLEAYRRMRQTYRLECPERFNFGVDVVDRWAEQRGDEAALVWIGPEGERRVSFAEMKRRTDHLAGAMAGLGLGRGERVLVMLPSVVEWWEAMVGLTKAGVIPIPATSLLTPHDIRYRLEAAEVATVITDVDGAAKVDEAAGGLGTAPRKVLVGGGEREGWCGYEQLISAAPKRWEPIDTRSDEPALIYFTSGTTGPPKMVLHTHASYGIGHRITAEFWLGLRAGDLHWNISDTGWAKTAYSGLFGPWIAGATVFVRHRPGKFDAADVVEQLEKYSITTLCAPPTVYRMLIQLDLGAFSPKALRRCMAAGEPLNPVVLEAWKKATGIAIREGYGQTETVILCCSVPQAPVKPGSMGLAPPTIDLAVIDEQGERLPTGETGQIAVRVEPERPTGLFAGYWRNEKATAKCYRDGWYLTGDCAYTDHEGYFWFVSRSDDIITSAAYRIGPFEVESVLMEHPAVAEAAVIGKPDPQRTEIVMAFVVLAKGYEPNDALKRELQEYVKQRTAPYKYPREIAFLDELPKTVSGKVRRVDLRRMC